MAVAAGQRTGTGAEARSRGRYAGITLDDVLTAAERVIERVGFPAASMTAIAKELGVTPGALYHHVHNKQSLLDAVADRFFAREVLKGVSTRNSSALDGVRTVCRRLRRAAQRHPAIVAVVAGNVPAGSESAQIRTADTVLRLLDEAGAAPGRAEFLYRTLMGLSLGTGIYEANFARGGAARNRQRLERMLDDTAYDRVAVYARAIADISPDDRFEEQLSLVLAELDATGG